MKVLIISMTCGEGHNSIAKAIKNQLEALGEEAKMIQLYGFSQKEVLKQNKMFLNAIKFIPHIYSQIWKSQCKKPLKFYINAVIKHCKDYVLKEINLFQPDAIVCTHNNSGAVVGYLKKEGMISDKITTYTVVFDYCLCPNWESNKYLDYVVTPDANIADSLKKKGFKEEQILNIGLPTDSKYFNKIDKKQARREIGLDEDKFTIILYSGGNCVSSAYDIIKKLKSLTNVQIVAICGKNKKEFEKIEKLIEKEKLTNVINLGFCTYIDKLYSAGDVVFTRGGGMGLTEQINKGIPFILREKLYINENINKKYFDKLGMGIAMKNLRQAPKIVETLLSSPDKLEDMRNKIEEYKKGNSTEKLVNHIINKKIS